MLSWKLCVEDYGKIKHAEIEAAPLTLFVGDNNSGKSYLLALLWGIKNFGTSFLMGTQISETEEMERLTKCLFKLFQTAVEKKRAAVLFKEIVYDLEEILNAALEERKDILAKKIFNSDNVKIGKLEIKFENPGDERLQCLYDEKVDSFKFFFHTNNIFGLAKNLVEDHDKDVVSWLVLQALCGIIIGTKSIIGYDVSDDVYLPAARTGFMLTKDIINKFSRNNTFNLSDEKEEITPFIRPINHFLDVMGDLSLESTGRKECVKIAEDIEYEMAHGIIEFSTMPNREVMYIPSGYQNGIPLRISSAVVTELSPLVLILKHDKAVRCLYYEEPEMCLHPQLQQKMGKFIGRIVNAGTEMVITTHSDIILQHINNMIKLEKRQNRQGICMQLGYTEKDLLRCDQIKVYQFNEEYNGKTRVQELRCGENGFCVPTFNDALDKIMDEAYEIQE